MREIRTSVLDEREVGTESKARYSGTGDAISHAFLPGSPSVNPFQRSPAKVRLRLFGYRLATLLKGVFRGRK